MQITICRADLVGQKANCKYPIVEIVGDADAMKAVAAFDHVCGMYKDNYRSNSNFMSSDVAVMDLDNDHSDNPADWITAEKLDGILPDISYILVPSRHHMLEKDGQSARPRYHVYFPITKVTDVEQYTALKRGIHVPSHTLVLYTNHLPKVGANDDGIWRRLVVIPFNAHITGDSDVKNYADYLFENAGSAVLAWIIEGAQKAIAQNYKISTPKCVEDAIEAYREDNNWLGHFIDECCDVDSANTEKSGELYQQYRAYCQQTGEYPRSTTDFASALEKAGFEKHKTNAGIIVRGLKLKVGTEFLG